ncbi:hypothetical protein PROP_00824 [Propionicimonas sp. T2.31MG-18]|uniref:DUF3099 domain-containing protein n=1 Tax=Propionicimonas sp. T2.31MG-18 TaxID=3157620 RepID=UPI0035E88868
MSPLHLPRPTLITSARPGRTLDTHDRQVRYLWTMAVRVACFIAATLTPLPWNLLLLLAAAVLPAIAVMLANAIDQRRPPEPPAPEPVSRPELAGPGTVKGTVED